MPPWFLTFALAAEPFDGTGPAPRTRVETVLSWAEVGFAEAGPESPAIGPDLLALGPGALAAVYDPVGHRVLVVGGASFPVERADDLAFTAEGHLLRMDDAARVLSVHDRDGAVLGARSFPGIVPVGGTLGLDGDTVCSVDAFGNGHPLATIDASGALREPDGPALRPGRSVSDLAAGGAARSVGDWLLVERLDGGRVARTAVSADGWTLELPVGGRLYAPSRDVSVSPAGTLGWLDPRADGLHLVRVSP